MHICSLFFTKIISTLPVKGFWGRAAAAARSDHSGASHWVIKGTRGRNQVISLMIFYHNVFTNSGRESSLNLCRTAQGLELLISIDQLSSDAKVKALCAEVSNYVPMNINTVTSLYFIFVRFCYELQELSSWRATPAYCSVCHWWRHMAWKTMT